MTNRKIRVLVGKVGLDGHDRGAKLVANALSKSGMEVVYTGLRQTTRSIVETAIQEDVDFLGLSFLAGDHMTLAPKVIGELMKRGAGDIKLIVGGIISKPQTTELLSFGIDRVFRPGTPLAEIVDYVKENAGETTRSEISNN
ncbi:MAG: cobalamin B12-binding domain-containing protein [Proteobacteria bacterium]|nr:cobalamin B12-binding domain-containing protein [Pseudomonadota bacterium]